MTFEELESEALKLSFDERELLAHILYKSLEDEPVDPLVQQAILEEVERRCQELEEGKAELIPGDQVFAELRAEFENKGR